MAQDNDIIVWSLCVEDIIHVARAKGIENPEEFVEDNLHSIKKGISFGLEFWPDVVGSAIDGV